MHFFMVQMMIEHLDCLNLYNFVCFIVGMLFEIWILYSRSVQWSVVGLG